MECKHLALVLSCFFRRAANQRARTLHCAAVPFSPRKVLIAICAVTIRTLRVIVSNPLAEVLELQAVNVAAWCAALATIRR